jgi:hypothetical protein
MHNLNTSSSRRLLTITLGVCFATFGAHAAPFSTTNLLTNPGAEAGNISGWTVGGTSNPDVDNGAFDPGINPNTGSFDFYGHNGFSGTLSQTVSLIGNQGITQSLLNAGLVADVSFWEQGLNQGTPSDDGQITLMFLDSSNNTLGNVSTPVVDSHDGAWQQEVDQFVIPTQTASIVYTMNFLRNSGSDNDSFIDDNSLTVGTGAVIIKSAAPEPATLGLLTLGGLFAGLGVLRRRRQ